jgi:HEAT repeat protein
MSCVRLRAEILDCLVPTKRRGWCLILHETSMDYIEVDLSGHYREIIVEMRHRPLSTMAECGIALALMTVTLSSVCESRQPVSPRQLLDQFQSTPVFWQQFEIAKQIVALHDPTVRAELVAWLNHEDRHLRGNAAFIFASLGDDRGFEVIRAILADRSYRPKAQGVPEAATDKRYAVEQQIMADRYYAAHLFGDLKDPRAVPVLIPLLSDVEVNYIVPWSLGEIGDKRAVAPLIKTLADKNPSMRVLAIYALEKLGAKDALPVLYRLLSDTETSDFGDQVSVAEAAKAAIIKLEAH